MNKKLLCAMLYLCLASCQSVINSNAPQDQPELTAPASPLRSPSIVSATESLQTKSVTENIPLSDFGEINLEIAFVSDKQIWHWKEGISTGLAQGNYTSEVRFSTDGKFLAYTTFSVDSPDLFDLWIYSINESKVKLLLDADILKTMVTSGSEFSNAKFEWVPGTYTILLSDEVSGQAYILDTVTEEVLKINSITDPGYVYLSPNGETLLLISPSEVFVVDIGSDIKKKLLDYETLSFGGEGQMPILPNWSADSLSFTIAIPSPNHTVPYMPTKVWNISVAGDIRLVAEFSADTNSSYISPDSSWVIYQKSTLPEYGSPVELHVLELESGKDILVAVGYIRFFSWSPVSLRFSFTETRNGSREFYLGHLQQKAVEITKLQPELSFSSWIDGERFFTQKLQIVHVNGSFISITDRKRIDNFDFVLIP